MSNNMRRSVKNAQNIQNTKKRKKFKFSTFILLSVFFLQLIVLTGVIVLKVTEAKMDSMYGKKIQDANNFTINKIQLKDANDQDMGAIGTGISSPTKFSEFSEFAIDAQLSSEDSKFYLHDGFDSFRTGIDLVRIGSGGGGASSITQQTARINFLRNANGSYDRTFTRKLNELAIAQGIEDKFSKSKILEIYMNTIQLSEFTYGTEATAQRLFSQSSDSLNIYQSLVISGMASSPSLYDPTSEDNYDAKKAKEHRDIMAGLLAKSNYASEFEVDAIKSMNFEDSFNIKESEEQEDIGKKAYIKGVLLEIQNKYGISPAINEKIEVKTNYDSSVQDSIYSAYKKTPTRSEDAFAIVDNKTSKVKGLYAGNGFKDISDFSYAVQGERSPGSTVKPLIPYATYIDQNKFGSQKLVDDKPVVYEGTNIPIKNFDGQTSATGQTTIRRALETSRNTSAVSTYRETRDQGYQSKMENIFNKVGFKYNGNDQVFEGTPLGSQNKISPLNLAAAYATFANGGIYNEPTFVREVINSESEKVDRQTKLVSEQLFSPETAYILADIGRSTVTNGTVASQTRSLANLPYWNGGKTGTAGIDQAGVDSSAASDLWYAGYNTQYSYAIWNGFNLTNTKNGDYVTDKDRPAQYAILSQILRGITGESSLKRPEGIAGNNGGALFFKNSPNNIPSEEPVLPERRTTTPNNNQQPTSTPPENNPTPQTTPNPNPETTPTLNPETTPNPNPETNPNPQPTPNPVPVPTPNQNPQPSTN